MAVMFVNTSNIVTFVGILIFMIIAFAFGLIASLLVLANSRHFRRNGIAVLIFIITLVIAACGIYFIMNYSKKMDARMLFPMFSPLTAMGLWLIARLIYRHKTGKEIILHLHGLFPVRQFERHVTGTEKNITFILLLLSVAIPYLLLILTK